MKVVAAIFARMQCIRLPAKAMAYVGGLPIVEHIFNRLSHAETLDEVVVATGRSYANNPIEKLCLKAGIPCFRGDEEDVLKRAVMAMREYEADALVRICGDRPLIDPQIVDEVVRKHLEGYDFTSNNFPRRTYPDGLDVEIFSKKTLRRLDDVAVGDEREHIVLHIWRNREKFSVGAVEHETDLSGHRWVLDYEEDLDFVRKVYYALWADKTMFYMRDILAFLEKNPDVSLLNACRR